MRWTTFLQRCMVTSSLHHRLQTKVVAKIIHITKTGIDKEIITIVSSSKARKDRIRTKITTPVTAKIIHKSLHTSSHMAQEKILHKICEAITETVLCNRDRIIIIIREAHSKVEIRRVNTLTIILKSKRSQPLTLNRNLQEPRQRSNRVVPHGRSIAAVDSLRAPVCET